MPGSFLPLYVVGAGTLAFDPSQLSLTGYWRANYSASPWSGTSSLGVSGSNSLSDFIVPPTTGGTQNGFTPAQFDGSTNELTADGTLDTYINATALSGFILVNVVNLTATRALMTDDNTAFQLYAFDSGGTSTFAMKLNSALTQATATYAGNTYQLFTFRYNGTNSRIGVNQAPGAAGGTTSIAYTSSITPLTGTVRVGWNSVSNLFLLGNVLEFGISDTALTDANFTSIKTYVNTRYGLSL